MVTVVDYAVRQNADGQDFIALILEGDIELVQSQETGQYYATARRCSITSTFNEVSATAIVGKQLPGQIIRQDCATYEYEIPETGEVIMLEHEYVFVPEEKVPKHRENGALAVV
ncbi:MAG: hypothetical protein R3345_15120 [Fulvivirga sp.]|nr:hypothetical protein [Fulvivirga sp.]